MDDVLQTGLLFGQPALLWASATLAVLVLPIVIVSTLEAFNSVPKSHRDASYGLGATKWQTIKNVVLTTGQTWYFNRNNSGNQPWSGRNCTNIIFWCSIFSSKSSDC